MIVAFNFFVLLLVMHLSGRGLFILLKKLNYIEQDISELKVFQIPINYFYILSYLIFLGNLTFVINFFIKVPKNLVLFSSFILMIFNFFNLKLPKIDLFIIFSTFLSLLFLSLSSYSTGLSYDAGLYHLNNQLWMKSEKIVIGLANLHMRYGYSSIFDYIAVNFNNFANFLYLHFVNISFLFVFFIIIFYLITQKNSVFYKASSLGLLIFGILDNFGFNGGKNGFLEIEGIAKYDSVFGSIFVLSAMFLINLIKQNKLNTFELNYFILISIFLVQLRPTGIIFILFSLIMLIKKFKIELFKLANNIWTYILFIFLIFWFLKNILISGCLVFPVEITCIENLKWYTSGYASGEALNISNSLRSYQLFTNPFEWFQNWINKNSFNLSTIINLIVSLLLIYTIKKILFTTGKVGRLQIEFLLYCLLLIFYWTLTAPDLRFAIGIFLTIVVTIFIDVLSIKKSNSQLVYFIIFAICVFTTPRLESYSKFLENIFENIYINAPENPEYLNKINSYGVTTKDNSEQCWINIECTPIYTQSVKKKYLGSYTMFIHNDN